MVSQNRALFKGGEKGEVPRKGEEEGWTAKKANREKGRVKTSQCLRIGTAFKGDFFKETRL